MVLRTPLITLIIHYICMLLFDNLMINVLLGVLILSFIALFVLNIVYRVRLMKMFKRISSLKLPFQLQHLWQKKQLVDEVITFYPEHEAFIWLFWRTLRQAIMIAIILLLTIILCGLIIYVYA